MADAMRNASGDDSFFAKHIENRPHLFSNLPVFLPRADLDRMLATVAAIEDVARLPAYQETAASWAPAIARHDHGPRGAFMGYDFHLAGDAPRLIEINTNAGGAFLNAFSAKAQLACCAEVATAIADAQASHFDRDVIAMLEAEWRLQGRVGRPTSIAIVDDAPEEQYLYPEFLLAQHLFEASGMVSLIADPSELTYDRHSLACRGQTIDLIYNRLVDFDLSQPQHGALRRAYEDGEAVLTPNPHNHATLADKRNLTLLTDTQRLQDWGVPEAARVALASIPKATSVTADNADGLWQRRKSLFFKPVAGYGSKAVYRGDKLTRSTWADIVGAAYIAQELALPGERMIKLEDETVARKVDVRLYTYDGRLLLAAARLYQGQTTNFRTEGGGFAPVFFV
ncbi:MAG: hypothetical protein Q8R02_16010 [Hyphomonadaceae bacterium]|nr:hypothetical protein [Hyphomonadaceae bacterium]